MKALVLMSSEIITVDELNVDLNATMTGDTPRYIDRKNGGRTYSENQVMIIADNSAAMCLPVKTLPQVTLELLKAMVGNPYAHSSKDVDLVRKSISLAREYFKQICGHGK